MTTDTRLSVFEWNKKRRALLLEEDIRVDLMLKIQASGLSVNAWATIQKLHGPEVHDFLGRRRSPGPKFRRVLGYELLKAYRKI